MLPGIAEKYRRIFRKGCGGCGGRGFSGSYGVFDAAVPKEPAVAAHDAAGNAAIGLCNIDRLFPFYGVRPPGRFWFTASAPVWSTGWFTIWRRKLKALLRINYLTKLGRRCNIFL